jgi:protease-4
MKKTLLILFVVFAAAALLFVGVVAYMLGAEPGVSKGTVLTIDLSLPVTEKGQAPGIEALLAGSTAHPMPARDIAATIRAAGEDDHITAILLHGGVSGSYSALSCVRDALSEARKNGKRIVAAHGSLDERALWLSSVADEAWLDPLGSVLVDGFSIDIPYMGELLAKYGVEVQVTRVGKYKSAVEPFMRSDMSPENREQLAGILAEIEGRVYGDIAEARGISLDSIREAARVDGLVTAKQALERKWITHVGPFGTMLASLKDLADVDEEDDLPQVALESYARKMDHAAPRGDVIELVQAEGEIVDGSSGSGIGGDDLARRLRAARFDDDVVAVVMRVDSPGGSATASDVIRQELLALKSAGKTVVVSMGAVAASGGYWISADADAIVAQPETITGSIGVFGMLPNIERLAGEHGLREETVSTSPLGGWDSLMRRKTPGQLAVIQGHVDEIYERFLDLVAAGRKLDRAQVAEIAQGRVWSGSKAKELGLVDELGDLDRAIELARERCGEPKAKLRAERRQLDFIEQVIDDMLEQQREDLASIQRHPALQAARVAERVHALVGRTGVMARLPFDPHLR